MILESAFYKLPELLETSAARQQVREATVVHAMATAVLMELNARNIQHPTQHVVVEKRFDTHGPAANYSADLYCQLNGAISQPELVEGYGYRTDNWLEGKAYLGRPPKRRLEDIGGIVRDLMRLCVFPEELQGGIRQNARYLLVLSSTDPANFWNGSDDRQWITELTIPGARKFSVPTNKLKQTSLNKIGGMKSSASLPEMEFETFNITFRPDQSDVRSFSRFWGSLSRINRFKMNSSNWSLEFADNARAQWSKDQNDTLNVARIELADLMTPNAA